MKTKENAKFIQYKVKHKKQFYFLSKINVPGKSKDKKIFESKKSGKIQYVNEYKNEDKIYFYSFDYDMISGKKEYNNKIIITRKNNSVNIYKLKNNVRNISNKKEFNLDKKAKKIIGNKFQIIKKLNLDENIRMLCYPILREWYELTKKTYKGCLPNQITRLLRKSENLDHFLSLIFSQETKIVKKEIQKNIKDGNFEFFIRAYMIKNIYNSDEIIDILQKWTKPLDYYKSIYNRKYKDKILLDKNNFKQDPNSFILW